MIPHQSVQLYVQGVYRYHLELLLVTFIRISSDKQLIRRTISFCFQLNVINHLTTNIVSFQYYIYRQGVTVSIHLLNNSGAGQYGRSGFPRASLKTIGLRNLDGDGKKKKNHIIHIHLFISSGSDQPPARQILITSMSQLNIFKKVWLD